MRDMLLDPAATIPWTGALLAAAFLPLLAGAGRAAAGDDNGDVALTVEPSFLFVEHEGRVMPVLMADFEAPRGGLVTVEVGRRRLTYRASKLRRAFRRWLVPVPEVRRETRAAVTLARPGEEAMSAVATLRPQRRWRVFITPHTHFDIGFTDHQEVVWERQKDDLLRVIDLCEQTADWPEESRYRYTIEGWTLFDNFVDRLASNPEQVERLLALIRAGHVEVLACPHNIQTSVCSAEELIRSLYGVQRLREEHGIRIESAMLNDVPGYTWALPMLFRQAGVRYFSARANPIRAMFLWHLPGAVERPFWWQSPDGSRVLTWYTDSYREGNFFRGGFREGMLDDPNNDGGDYRGMIRFLADIERHGYRHDAVQMRMGGDNLEAVLEPCRFAREWNRHFAFPRLIMATNRDFFRHLAASGDRFPTYRGDIPDWWADGVASAAAETARNRQTQDLLAQAEALMAMARLAGAAPPGGDAGTAAVYPYSLIPPADAAAEVQARAGYDFALLFDEHTWGGGRGLRDRDRAAYDASWDTKAGYGATAADCARRAFEAALGELRPRLPGTGRRLLVINTLAWPRTDLVRVEGLRADAVRIIDPDSGRALPHQALPEGGLCFVAEAVPAFGAKAFPIEDAGAGGAPAAPDADQGRYRLRIDDAARRVSGIVNLRTGRELIDADAAWPFDAYIYESEHFGDKFRPHEGRPQTEGSYRADEPLEARFTDDGPVFRRLIIRSRGVRAPSITREIILYRGLDRVEVVNEIEKEATLEKEGIYFAFPFAVPGGEFAAELPNAAMRPERDQLAYSARDFYALQHWVEVANRDFGITWVSLDAPLVAVGEIRTNDWSEHIEITSAAIYSYVMNNYWFTNYPLEQGGSARFRYAFRAHQGPADRAAATRFGWELACPLIGVVAEGGVAVSVAGEGDAAASIAAHGDAPTDHDRPMLAGESLLRCEGRTSILQQLKPARDGRGVVARLLETAGRSDTVTLSLPRPFAAWRTDLLENDGRRLRVADRRVRLRLRPHQLATVRLVREE